mmetsp:Transcript_6315/g.13830  ORF Transcript_6315/g.13830 Transcript_6315/m.13830 type:complete len:115 (-) Transcript_6315:133-477(-)
MFCKVERPTLVSQYFKDSPKVDNHNQTRQHELALEEEWQTQDCWFRLLTTLFGICVTDTKKAAEAHLLDDTRAAAGRPRPRRHSWLVLEVFEARNIHVQHLANETSRMHVVQAR